MTVLTLTTPRLLMRAFVQDDAEAFSAYRSDPDVARFQSWDTPFPLAAARRFIDEVGSGEPLVAGEWSQLAICRRTDDVLLGDCGVQPLSDDPRIVEIGFTLAREHQGLGYASEAVARLLAFLFGERSPVTTHRVIAGCDTRNTRSARLLERVGMRREAHHVESEWFKGEWISEYRYAVLRREWAGGLSQ